MSVKALNKYIETLFRDDHNLRKVYVRGEVSNFRPHPSGHMYFTLKDEESTISVVMFVREALKLDFQLENGMQILVEGRVDVYYKQGKYQIIASSINQDGIGNLYVAYLQLKNKLEKEGLFDERYKKPIPVFPHNIAVLSAKQGAAVRDVVRTLQSRAPFVNIVIFPVPVQGEKAYEKICSTLRNVDQCGFDTIIIARGGGSLEDLYNFNSELLARTIFDCQTPIISGIGHETDFTICDFVSDFRAVTPTGAAIKATPDCKELRKNSELLKRQLINSMNLRINDESRKLDRLIHSYFFENPDQLYNNELLRLSSLEQSLVSSITMFDTHNRQILNNLVISLENSFNENIKDRQHRLKLDIEKLDAYSPLKILSRGYSLVYKDETLIKSADAINQEDVLTIKLSDGKIKSKVIEVEK